jgi:hypothetical protein
MTTLPTSAGTAAYDSRGSGDLVVLLPSAIETARDLIPGSRLAVIDTGLLPHPTSPAAVAAELASPASTAFDGASRTDNPQHRPPGPKEQQQ